MVRKPCVSAENKPRYSSYRRKVNCKYLLICMQIRKKSPTTAARKHYRPKTTQGIHRSQGWIHFQMPLLHFHRRVGIQFRRFSGASINEDHHLACPLFFYTANPHFLRSLVFAVNRWKIPELPPGLQLDRLQVICDQKKNRTVSITLATRIRHSVQQKSLGTLAPHNIQMRITQHDYTTYR